MYINISKEISILALAAWLFTWCGDLISPNFVIGYDEISGFQSGHLKGTVTLKGQLSKPRRYNLVVSPDPYYCGRISDGKGWRLSPNIQLNSNHQGVPNVIVFLDGINSGKPIGLHTPTIKAKDCRFAPYISLIQKGAVSRFENWDPVQHKLEIYFASNQGGRLLSSQDLKQSPTSRKSDFLVPGNIGTHRPGQVVTYKTKNEGRLVFRCSYHEYMEGWGLVLAHPYHTYSDHKGEFSITDIPIGSYTVVVWHPLGRTEETIRIRTDQTLSIDVAFRPTPANAHSEKNGQTNPFGIDLIGDANIDPSVELQQWPD